jgi:hypothetical protein
MIGRPCPGHESEQGATCKDVWDSAFASWLQGYAIGIMHGGYIAIIFDFLLQDQRIEGSRRVTIVQGITITNIKYLDAIKLIITK